MRFILVRFTLMTTRHEDRADPTDDIDTRMPLRALILVGLLGPKRGMAAGLEAERVQDLPVRIARRGLRPTFGHEPCLI